MREGLNLIKAMYSGIPYLPSVREREKEREREREREREKEREREREREGLDFDIQHTTKTPFLLRNSS